MPASDTRRADADAPVAAGLATALGGAALGVLMIRRAWRRWSAYEFANRTVVITGGSRGLGLVLARELAREGANLVLVARDPEELQRAAVDIRARRPPVRVLTVAADIRRQADAERMIVAAVDHFGGIDVLINNAGIIQVGPIDHMELADYEDAMRTHFWGPLHAMQAALPYMRQQGAGRIVNISSIGGRVAVPHLVPYCASKFALMGLSDGLRAELTRNDIVVTTVCPGLMRTGSPVNATFKGRQPDEYAWFAIADSLPLVSIDARRAARRILDACRHGDAELVITGAAKLAILARTLAPQLFARAMALVNRALPEPTSADGDRSQRGRESESSWASPSAKLTAPTYRAAVANNEL
jgi:NAD(P)-dependent dehydrogenase (short-subunit alcohol dehydrogenase family)